MKTFKKLFLLTLVSYSYCQFSYGNEELEKKIIESSVPSSISSLKDQDSGELLSFKDGGLNYSYKSVDFDGSGKNKYLVVLYKAEISTTDTICDLVVFQIKNSSSTAIPTPSPNGASGLNNCLDLEIRDLDGDKNPEVLVTTVTNKTGDNESLHVFTWIKTSLKDVTPVTTYNGRVISAFRNTNILEQRIGRSSIILDSPQTYFLHGEESGKSPDQTYNVYVLKEGVISRIGNYDFYTILEKKLLKPVEVAIIKPKFDSEGSYTLELKNLSTHPRAVRAEVIVNGSKVLSSKDFCSSPQPKKSEKDKWKGNDDEDDKDEDGCKRCTPKSDVYAIVNLKKENEIKVKVFGLGGSKLQLTLVKK